MIREITEDEFHRRTGGVHRDQSEWRDDRPITGYYEIDLDSPAVCDMGTAAILTQLLVRTGHIDMQDGWRHSDVDQLFV